MFVVPALVQRILDDLHVPVVSGALGNAQPNNADISIAATMKIPLGLTAYIDPLALNLVQLDVNASEPYAQLHFPRLKVHGESTIGVQDQPTNITYMPGFQGFIDPPRYIWIHLSHSLMISIG